MPTETQSIEIGKPSQSLVDQAKEQSYNFLNPEVWRIMTTVASTFLQSGAMPKSMDTAPKLMVALQAGQEAGLKPLEAINGFYFVNGKVSIYGEVAILQVLKAGHKIEWGICNEKEANIKITRGDNQATSEVKFTIEQAEKKGLTKDNGGRVKPVWSKWPENMLRFKAFHSCVRFLCPDALHGVPIKEVVEGEIIEVEETKKEVPKQKEKNIEKPKKEESLAEAITKEEPKQDEKEKKETSTKKVEKKKETKSPAMQKLKKAAEQSGLKI